MRRVLLCLLLASPLTNATADEPPNTPTKQIDPTTEDLAHWVFHSHPRSQEVLANVVSAQGLQTVSAVAEQHSRLMNGPDALMRKARAMCADLTKAQTGEEFAATLTLWDQTERAEQRQYAAQLLAQLDQSDRKALEDYLNTTYRQGFGSFALDYQAMFAALPFPSETSRRMLHTICNAPAPEA